MKLKLFKKKFENTERGKFHRRKKELELLEKAEEEKDQKELARLKKEQIKQARYYAGLLPRALETQRLASSVTKHDSKGRAKKMVRRVRLVPPVLIHHDYFMYQVNMRHLPTGVSADKMKDTETLRTLSFALETEVQVDDSDYRGFWFLVARVGGAGIIPNKVGYQDVIDTMPKRASNWAIPIGVGENKKLTWLDIRQKPHFLIAGSTGSGKSVFLKNMLLTLAMNNSPSRLRIVLADFKAGADMVPLAKLPHLGTPSKIRVKKSEYDFDGDDLKTKTEDDYADYIITEPKDVLPVLHWADRETNRRNRKFAEVGDETVTNINEYNAKFRHRPMPRVMIVLDEFPVAVLEVGGKDAAIIRRLISAITRKGRSAGISIVLGSQGANAEVLDGAISQNITTRLAGFSTGPQSQTIMGSWFASRISNRPGRMAFRDDLEEKELQTPWIPPTLASKLVKTICEKWDNNKDEDTTALKLFDFCLDKADGVFDPTTLFKHFPDDTSITRRACYEIGKQYELQTNDDGELGPVIRLQEVDFYLLPAVSGQRPRKLVTVEEYNAKQQALAEPEPEPETPPAEPEPCVITMQEIVETSLAENNGDLGSKWIFDTFRERGMTKSMAESVGPSEIGTIYSTATGDYAIERGERRNRPYHLELVSIPRSPLPENQVSDAKNETDRGASTIQDDDVPDWLQSIEDDANG